MVPTVAAGLMMLVKPDLWRLFTEGAVSHYALAAEGWRQLRRSAPLDPLSPTTA